MGMDGDGRDGERGPRDDRMVERGRCEDYKIFAREKISVSNCLTVCKTFRR